MKNEQNKLKLNLHKENINERYCIIDFSKEDFKAIDNGENFIEIVKNKIKALQLDTDYRKFLSEHLI